MELRRFTQPTVPVHKYCRTTSQAFTMTPSTGWNAGGFDLEIGFSLSVTNFYIAGALASAAANPGASDFTALYDFYRLDKVELCFMLSSNIYAPGTLAAAPALPILNIAFDPSDVSVTSLSSILQYQNLQTVQLGNQRTQSGYVVVCQPRPRMTAGGNATAAVEVNPWMNKDVTTTEYLGVKVFYDAGGSTVSTAIGSITIYTKYFWSFKLSQ